MLTEPQPAGLTETLRALITVWKERETKSELPVHATIAVLSRDPLIVYTPLFQGPLGFAGWAHRVGIEKQATFLLALWWSKETSSGVKRLRRHAILHRLRRPQQRLIFLCNTEVEADLLRGQGETAIVLNHNCTVSESIFRPLQDVRMEYQAIYNARLTPSKRHELTLAIDSCAFIFYRYNETPEVERLLIARHNREAPGHRFINGFDESGAPIRISPDEVNVELNRAAVGLCLSATEGAMYSSMEYMLAGLPIVSTPSKGGRDVYFDPDYCLVVDPDPRAVRDAVQALCERRIPREVIRSRTLQRIERDRSRFLDLLNEILADSGAAPAFAMPWPFAQSKLVTRVACDSIVATLDPEGPRAGSAEARI